jgi:hypothetical protein
MNQNADPLWPPSPEHLGYHEAGHAVLMDAFGQGIRYIAIEPDSQNWASFAVPNEETAASRYGRAVIDGDGASAAKPTAEQLAEYLMILVGGEVAAHLWSETEDDSQICISLWHSDVHDEQNRADPRHREIRQACLVSTRFLDGNMDEARNLVTRQIEQATIELRRRWPAVKAVATALVADYRRARSLERSIAPVQGALPAPKPTRLIRGALATADAMLSAEE